VLGHRTIPEIQAQTRVEIQTHLHALRNAPKPPTYATQLIAFGAHLIDQNVSQFQLRELRTQNAQTKIAAGFCYVLSDVAYKTLLTAL